MVGGGSQFCKVTMEKMWLKEDKGMFYIEYDRLLKNSKGFDMVYSPHCRRGTKKP